MPIRLFTFAPPPSSSLPPPSHILKANPTSLYSYSTIRTKNTLATFLALTGVGVLAANMNNTKPRAEKEDRTNGEGGFALRGCERSGLLFPFSPNPLCLHNNGLG